jgi:restriction system protein
MSKLKLTMIQAAQKAIIDLGKPSTAIEIYEHILKEQIYQFNAKDPQSILKSTLRRHSREHSVTQKKSTQLLKIVGSNKYDLI